MTGIPPRAAGRRWFAVGASGADGRRAGRDAAATAVVGDDPRLLVVFASDDLDLEGIFGGIRDVAPGVPLVGCTTAGEIGPDGPGGGGLVVSALGGEGFRVTTAVATGASHRLREAGAEAAGCIREVPDGEHTVLMLLSDGLSGDQQEVVRGAYSVAGVSVPLVGGCAGDDLRMRRLVTSSRDNRVHTLDDRPAFDVYLERVGAPASLGRDAAAFHALRADAPAGPPPPQR